MNTPLQALGPYQLLGELGRGGFGVVWRARAPSGAEVALKVPHQGPTPELVARIRREAQLARRLTHPGLVRLLDLLELPDRPPVLVYEYLRGRPLEKLVPPGGLPLAEALPLLRDLAGALDALHDAGLVHRDVKPENALVGEDGRLRLLDLGLLRPDRPGQTLTATGMLVGTPAFMAPEVLGGEPLDPASDRYSLACTAWCLLTGAPPFQGELGDVVQAHLKQPPPPLPAWLEAAEPQLRRPLEAGLAKHPGERPASCRELVEGLAPEACPRPPGGLPDSQAISLSPPAPSAPTARLPLAVAPREPAPRGSRFSRWTMALLLVGLTVGALLLPGDESPSSPPPPSPPPPGWVHTEALLREEFSHLGDLWFTEGGKPLLSEEGDLPSGARSLQDLDPFLADLRREHTPRLQELLRSHLTAEEPPTLSGEELRILEEYDDLRGRSGLPPLFAILATAPLESPEPIAPLILERAREENLLEALPERAGGWLGAALAAGAEALEERLRLVEHFEESPEEFFPDFQRQTSQLLTESSKAPLWSTIRNLGGIAENRVEATRMTRKGGIALRRCLYSALRSFESEPASRVWAGSLVRRLVSRTRSLHPQFLLDLPPDLLLLRPATTPEGALVLAELLDDLDGLRLNWKMSRAGHSGALTRACRTALSGTGDSDQDRQRRSRAWSHLLSQGARLPDLEPALGAIREYWPQVRGGNPGVYGPGVMELVGRLERDRALPLSQEPTRTYLAEILQKLDEGLGLVNPRTRADWRTRLERIQPQLEPSLGPGGGSQP